VLNRTQPGIIDCYLCKVEEKRENFSPRKLRKPGERENFCWKVTFSRENFSPEKTDYFAPDEHDNCGAQARRQAKKAIHTLYDEVTDKVEIFGVDRWICYPPNYFPNKFQEV
jgi:hypothetical protein